MSCLIKTVPQERPTHRAGMGGTSTILNHLATLNPSAAHSLMPWLSWPKDGGVNMWNDLGIRSVKFVHFRTMVRFCQVLKIYWYVFNISWISCMFLYVLALLNSYYLLFVYSHELCHVRLAEAILLQRRLKALALLQWARRCLWLSNRPQTCPKNVPKMSLPHISATSVSARARERVLVLGNSTIGDGHEDHEVRSKTLQ